MDNSISYPSKSYKREIKYISKKYKNSKPKKEYNNKPPVEKYRQSSSKKLKKDKNKYKSKKDIICYKCGCPGHYSNKCIMKQKINNIKLEDDLKSQLLELLINSSSS